MGDAKKDDPALDEARKREAQLEDIRAILRTDSGKRFFWRLLEESMVFESVWDPSVKMHRNAGKQDLGRWALGELMEADFESWLQMSRNVRRELMEAAVREEKSKGGK